MRVAHSNILRNLTLYQSKCFSTESFFKAAKSKIRSYIRGEHVIRPALRLVESCDKQSQKDAWFAGGKLQHTFKTRHLLNTMHIWMMHKRLLTESDKDRFLMIQENMFDMFWEDTVDRISKEDVSSISLNKYLKQVQDISFQMCTHFDEVVTCKNNEMEEIKHYEFVIWDNIYDGQESANKADMKQLAKYLRHNRATVVTTSFEDFLEGNIAWSEPWQSPSGGDNEPERERAAHRSKASKYGYHQRKN